MSIALNDKVCVITGADEGVGRGLVEGFLKRGARVAAGILREETQVPDGAFPVVMDVRDQEQVEAGIGAVLTEFGRIDVLINNAGVYPRRAVDEMTTDEWNEVTDINLHGSWRCAQAVIPHLKRSQGRIINVGSITLKVGMAHLSHYMASKGGIIGLTRGLARDLGRYGIRANCIDLGAVQTEGEIRLFPDQEAVTKAVEEKQCLPGRLTPQSVEPVFAFLASDLSNDITGQCITVDRGWTH